MKPVTTINHITDKENCIQIYHGINVSNHSKHSAMRKPWQTIEDYKKLNEWGFNCVRYLVFWDTLEPEEGCYNDAYIQSIIEEMNTLQSLGIDVILDMHQDLYAEIFGGNGFPEWTVEMGGHIYEQQWPWYKNYDSPAVEHCYVNFWTSEHLKQKYISAIKYLLSKIDWINNVTGIDVMNEPLPRYPGDFDKDCLSDFYRNIWVMMRENCFKTRMYYEPHIGTTDGNKSYMELLFDSTTVYSPHFYDTKIDQGKTQYLEKNKAKMQNAVRIKFEEAQKYGSCLFYGEFGLSGKEDIGGYLQSLTDFMDLCDNYGASWTFWTYDKNTSYGILDKDGNEKWDRLQTLIRPYPQKIAGMNPTYMFKDSVFTLEYSNIGINHPTVIFLPTDFDYVIESTGTYRRKGNLLYHENSHDEKQTIRVQL